MNWFVESDFKKRQPAKKRAGVLLSIAGPIVEWKLLFLPLPVLRERVGVRVHCVRVMTPHPDTVRSSMTILEALKKMLEVYGK